MESTTFAPNALWDHRRWCLRPEFFRPILIRMDERKTIMTRYVIQFLLLCRSIDAFQGYGTLSRRIASHPATATATEEKVENCYTFQSPEMKVFIEDTDAYGIMYNGNYLRSYDRVLHLCTSNKNNGDADDDDEATTTDRVTTNHNDWSIVSMGNQKFVTSPALGSNFVVEGTLKYSSQDLETWDLKMTSPDGDTVFNSVQDLKIARPTGNNKAEFSLPFVEAFSFEDGAALPGSTDTFTVYRDEFDAHSGHLPLRNVLNLFERSRSNVLGGPDELRKLQEDHGILVVVASIGDCSLIGDEGATVQAGERVTVETWGVVKRKGMILDCYQTLKTENGGRLAQGKVTLMMINTASYRPTSNLPDWLKEILGLL